MSNKQNFKSIKPKIMYYGTPTLLLNTLNEDGTTNISPISSSWALGDYVVLGIGLGGKAYDNLMRHKECVINLPSPDLWENVEKISSFTGKEDVPPEKRAIGFSYKKDKYRASGLTAIPSQSVLPNRIAECPIQMETAVKNIHVPACHPLFAIVEAQVIHFHANEDIIYKENYIDPTKWSPLIYNFRHYYKLGDELGKTYRAEI